VAAVLAATLAAATTRSEALAQRSVDEVWSAYQQRWATTDTYAADFHQRIEIEGIGGEVESAGKFYFAKPDRMRWDYLQGQPQNVVGDGKWVWVYQPDLEQVYKVGYEEAFGSGGLVALLANRSGLTARYRLELVERGDGLIHVRLTPKADVGETLEVAMAPDTLDLRSVVINDPAGSVTIVDFKDVRRNSPVEDTLFHFTPPAGVDVITAPPPQSAPAPAPAK
jgi:outer membrane lipoprotein carrier protein